MTIEQEITILLNNYRYPLIISGVTFENREIAEIMLVALKVPNIDEITSDDGRMTIHYDITEQNV